jgi:hypothetical protein
MTPVRSMGMSFSIMPPWVDYSATGRPGSRFKV